MGFQFYQSADYKWIYETKGLYFKMYDYRSIKFIHSNVSSFGRNRNGRSNDPGTASNHVFNYKNFRPRLIAAGKRMWSITSSGAQRSIIVFMERCLNCFFCLFFFFLYKVSPEYFTFSQTNCLCEVVWDSSGTCRTQQRVI